MLISNLRALKKSGKNFFFFFFFFGSRHLGTSVFLSSRHCFLSFQYLKLFEQSICSYAFLDLTIH